MEKKPAAISTDEFIRKARFAGVREVTLIISYRADMQSRKVKTLDFTLSSQDEEMKDWVGIDRNICWFDDGATISDTSGARAFTSYGEPRGSALSRTQELLLVIHKVEQSGLELTIIGPNINVIFDWIKRTLGEK